MQLTDKSLLRQQGYINGQWQNAANCFPIHNPANGEIIAKVSDLGAMETEQAILAAVEVLPTWQQTSPRQRADLLRAWLKLIQDHKEDLAQILHLENGKPMEQARGEIDYSCSFIDWFAAEGERTYGEVIPSSVSDRRYLTIKQSIGVVAAITPWNFPSAMIARKAAPALAAGCP